MTFLYVFWIRNKTMQQYPCLSMICKNFFLSVNSHDTIYYQSTSMIQASNHCFLMSCYINITDVITCYCIMWYCSEKSILAKQIKNRLIDWCLTPPIHTIPLVSLHRYIIWYLECNIIRTIPFKEKHPPKEEKCVFMSFL